MKKNKQTKKPSRIYSMPTFPKKWNVLHTILCLILLTRMYPKSESPTPPTSQWEPFEALPTSLPLPSVRVLKAEGQVFKSHPC